MSENYIQQLRKEIDDVFFDYKQYMLSLTDLCGCWVEHKESDNDIDLLFLESTVEWRHNILKENIIECLTKYEQAN